METRKLEVKTDLLSALHSAARGLHWVENDTFPDKQLQGCGPESGLNF